MADQVTSIGKERTKPRRLAAVVAVTGLAVLALSTDTALRAIETLRFGTPSQVCMGSRALQFDDKWLLELLYQPERKAVYLYGLLPVPREWAGVKLNEGLLTFRARTGAGVRVSWHVTSSMITPESLSQDCIANSACQLRKLDLGEVLTVAYVKGGADSWAVVAGEPLMVGVHGGGVEDLTGFRVATCSQPD